jgi:hypothetical protein
MKVLEKPEGKKIAKCQTPFDDYEGLPSSWPPRERCQQIVTADERKQVAELVATYRENEEIFRRNDTGAYSRTIYKLEHPVIGGSDPVRAEQLRRERSLCDHQACLAAETILHELQHDAKALAKILLERLENSINDELTELAIESETRLAREGVPISNSRQWEAWNRDRMERLKVDGYVQFGVINQLPPEPPRSDFTLWHDPVINWRWSWREIVRRKLEKLDWSGEGLGVCQYFCTDEPGNPGGFAWG